jgi:hypothetical protein
VQDSIDRAVARVRAERPATLPAGTTDAVSQIIDQARTRGYCFGVVDRTGQVVADRYVTSSDPIPQIAASVPYNFMERPGTPLDPWFVAPDPIAISATHSPEPFRRGDWQHADADRHEHQRSAERCRSGRRQRRHGARPTPAGPPGNLGLGTRLDVLRLGHADLPADGHTRPWRQLTNAASQITNAIVPAPAGSDRPAPRRPDRPTALRSLRAGRPATG